MVSRPLLSLLALLCLSSTAPRTHGAEGTLVSWGNDQWGQVSGTPTGTFSTVAAGANHSVAIRTDGTLVSWGYDGSGQVRGTPAGHFSAIAAGFDHSVAIRTDGTLFSWGSDRYGQVSSTPTGTFSAVAAASYRSVAIRTDGNIVFWPLDLYHCSPRIATAVAMGELHSLIIRPNDSLESCGANTQGVVSETPSGTFSAIAAGSSHSVAIRTDGTLISWGLDNWGQVTSTPTGTFSAVDGGGFHTVALRTEGTLVSWGYDFYGQVSGTPVGRFSAVAAGFFHSVAITASTADQVSELIALVESMSVQHGVKNALLVKLQAALAALNAKDTPAACSRLQDFLNQVNAQTGKKLTPAQATQLIEATTRIRGAIGC